MNKKFLLCIAFTCLAAMASAQQFATENMLNKYEFLRSNIYGVTRSGDNYYFAGSFDEGFGVPNANNIVRYNIKTNTFSKVGPSLNDDVLEIAATANGFVARGIFSNVGGDENVSEIAYYNEATNTMTGLPGKQGIGFRFKKDDPYRMLGIGTDVYLFSVLENTHIDREAGEVNEGHMIMRLDGSKPELPQTLSARNFTIPFVTGKDHLDRTTYAIKDGHRVFGLGYTATKDTIFIIGEFSVRERNPEYHKAAPPAEQPAAAPAEKPKKKGGLLGKLTGSGEGSEESSNNKGAGNKKQKYDGNPVVADVLGYDMKNNVWFPIIPSLSEKTVVADHPDMPGVEMVESNKFFAKHGGAYNGEVRSIVKIGGTYYFGGTFSQWGGDASGKCVVSWNGTAFSTMDEGLNGEVHRLFGANGTLYAFGTFTESGTKTKLPNLAMWDAVNKKWVPVGSLTRQFKLESGWQTVNGVKKPYIIERDANVRAVNLVGDDLLVSGYFSFKDANGKLIVNFGRFDTKTKKWFAVIPAPPASAN